MTDFTKPNALKAAMEHSMIKASSNPKESAENVYKFFSVLVGKFTSEDTTAN